MMLFNVYKNEMNAVSHCEMHYVVSSLFGFGFTRTAYKFTKKDIYDVYLLACEYLCKKSNIDYKKVSKTLLCRVLYVLLSQNIKDSYEYLIDCVFDDKLQRSKIVNIKPLKIKINEK